MLKEFTCILCPNGCDIQADLDDKNTIQSINGANCQGGITYVHQELTDPKRTISSSVLVKGGVLPLVSVRLSHPVPKKHIFDIMEQIKSISLTAPVRSGDVVLPNVLGLGSDVIATKDVEEICLK
jgi:CxxC motif-containing protein